MWWFLIPLYLAATAGALVWFHHAVGGRKEPAASIRWWFDHQSFAQGAIIVRITAEQRVKITVSPRTAKNKPAKIDGDVAFASSDENVARIEPIDNLSANVVGVAAGVVQITADFDANLGEGVTTIQATGAVEVVDPEATTGEIVFGEPEEQPATE